MKKIDLKPLLMEKGERIGLFVAGGLSLLLVVIGVLKGVSAGSSTTNAKKLTDQLNKLENDQRSARPREGSRDLPTETLDHTALNSFRFKEVSLDEYPSVATFTSPKVKDNKRQKPTILKTDEYAVALVPVALPGLSFQLEPRGDRKIPTHVTMMDPPKGAMGGAGGAAGALGAIGALLMGSGNQGFGNLFGQKGGAGAIGGAGAGGGVGGRAPGRFNPRGKFNAKAEQGEKTVEVAIADADSKKDKVFCVRALPMRVGVVSASFPFKLQVEEFRQKLRLDKHGDVLTERVRGEKDEAWNSFQFRGLIVERAEFDPSRPANRNVRLDDWKPKDEDWLPLPIEDSYKWILINVRRQVEEDPKDHKPIVDVGLVMKKPKALDPHFKYPDVTTQLKNIQATLDKLSKLSEDEKKKAVPKSSLIDDGFNAFQTGGTQTGGGGGGVAPPAGGKTGDGFNIPGTGPERDVKETPIDHCLIRFLDMSDDNDYALKPGKTYRYRFKIRMANPNYSPTPIERKDTYPDLAKDKELVSDWNYVDKDLVVPPDTYFYAYDANPRGTPPTPNETVFQFHRWVEEYRPKPNVDNQTPIGDWVVAPRVIIRRGEYVKSTYPCEVAVKNLNAHNFAVVSRAPIPFGDVTPWVDTTSVYPVMVDFEGGRMMFQRQEPPRKEGDPPRTVTLQDDVRQEVLILNPDGRVEAHHSAVDDLDAVRQKRFDEYKLRMENIKNKPGGVGPVFN